MPARRKPLVESGQRPQVVAGTLRSMIGEWEIVGRIAVAALLSALVGYEREFRGKPAGLRTHALVGIGAATFTVVGIIGFSGADEARVAAQIVTGVGFLGAGAIFRSGDGVEGLTTAAGLWAVAAIGMASGAGAWLPAVIATIAALLVMAVMAAIDAWVARRTTVMSRHVEVVLESTDGIRSILKLTARIDHRISQLDLQRDGEGGGVLTLSVPPEHASVAAEMVATIKGVRSARVVRALEMRRFDVE